MDMKELQQNNHPILSSENSQLVRFGKMYSGTDSTESANYGQWPLNPTLFQNMPTEQVDWAALAQQWIQMKEAGPPIPEPKKESNGKTKRGNIPSKNTDDCAANLSSNNISNPVNSFDNTWNWKQQQNWEWNNTWNTHLHTPQIVTPSAKATLLATPKGYPSLDKSNDNSILNSGFKNSRSSEFGTEFSVNLNNNSRHYKPHNRRYSKVNVAKAVTPIPLTISSASDMESNNLDASKRKQLPAWIREGLEKMEKDKQKQVEKEKGKQNAVTQEQELVMVKVLRNAIKERSKFESDEEHSPEKSEPLKEEPESLTHDEVMLMVRRTMTEILLKVTNKAIQSICEEEHQRYLKKIQTIGQDCGKANLTEKLGLGIYESDSGSETDSEAPKEDSDDDLQNAIKNRKADFIQTERGIEDKLLQAEQNKRNSKIYVADEESSSDNQFENTFESKIDNDGNFKIRAHLDMKHCQDSSHSSVMSDKESNLRKSSSRSRESSINTRKKNRSQSRDRGYTPEKRKRPKSNKRSRSRSYDHRSSADYKYYKKCKSHSDGSRRFRSRSRTSARRSRSRSSSYKSRRSSETSCRSRRKHSRSRHRSRKSRSRSHNRCSRTR